MTIDEEMPSKLLGTLATQSERIFEVARSVCLIQLPGGHGAGALIADGTILTAKHLFLDNRGKPVSAANFEEIFVLFFRRDANGALIGGTRVDPVAGSLRLAEGEADVASFRLQPFPADHPSPPELKLASEQVVAGARVSMVHWPIQADLQSVNSKWETASALDGATLHHTLDSGGGSSGSPVFNDAWEIVAVHNGSVEGDPEHNRATTAIRF